MGTLRIAHRIWQVYWVHLGVFFVTLDLMPALNASGMFLHDEVGALNLYPFLTDPGANLLGLLTLTHVPKYFDIRPMCLVILALIPVMIALVQMSVVLASLGLWAAAPAGLNLLAGLWFAKPQAREWFF